MTRTRWIALGLGLAVVASLLLSASLGTDVVAPGEAWDVLAARLTGGRGVGIADTVVWQLRMPRAVLALLVGAGLAVVGVAMQALVRNPLAEPYLLGLSGGASAGASLFYLGFLPPLVSRALSLPLAAFLGGLAAISVVFAVAQRRGQLSVARLLLGGVAVSALSGAVASMVTLASPEPQKMQAFLFWLMGSLDGVRWAQLPLPAAATVLTVGVLWLGARPLDALLLGEEPAQLLGLRVETLKRGLLLLSSLACGMLVAAAGTIGFVGLIVPHAVRALAGVPHRRVVPLSALAGGLFLLWADVAARMILPGRLLPVGIVTALCGVPFFLVLLRRGRYRFG